MDRERRLEEVNMLIETNLCLIGSSAIEDKLQDEVVPTLQALKQAGIKIWVLTGDKVETAINIGYAAGLLDRDMITIVVEASNDEEVRSELHKIQEEREKQPEQKLALIIMGSSLGLIQAES